MFIKIFMQQIYIDDVAIDVVNKNIVIELWFCLYINSTVALLNTNRKFFTLRVLLLVNILFLLFHQR